jgi:membrane protein YdbS with pleckstrin-like domain
MNGVEILNEYAVYTSQVWVAVVGLLSLIGAIIFGIAFHNSENDKPLWINCIGMIVCMVTLFTFAIIDNETNYLKEYSHIEYKVTIDDSVSMNEFLDKYEVLDQEGKIYTVKERER